MHKTPLVLPVICAFVLMPCVFIHLFVTDVKRKREAILDHFPP
jgi:hypothetical protein